tara:strand:+ start:254 stop:487 length:234 start_codon:yes stop_codon:yes gene_type:complete
MIKPDGYDGAIIGYEPSAERFVYDRQKMITIAVYDMDMSHEDAIEHLEYNVWGAWVGDQTPIYIELGKYDDLVAYID